MKRSVILICMALGISAQVMTNTAPQAVRTTSVCMYGYFWTGQSCMSCPTVSNGVCGCENNNGTCQTYRCNSLYQLSSNGSSCEHIPGQCPANCLSCGIANSTILCYNCTTGYGLVGNICVNKQNCQQLNQDSGICERCSDGFYNPWDYSPDQLSSNSLGYWLNYQSVDFCLKCAVAGCKICTSENNCVECQQGYFWQVGNSSNSGSCQQCASHCAQCSSNAVADCTACQANYYLNSTTKECQTCNVSNCETCSSPTICQQCKAGYQDTAKSGLACQKPPNPPTCGTGCANCSTGSSCNQCYDGYYLSSSSGCVLCGTGISTCSLSGVQVNASSCNDTYILKKGVGSVFTCQPCSTPFGNATRCELANSSDVTTGYPTQCADSFFLANGTCVPYQNPNTCYMIENNSSKDCQSCLPGYQRLNNGSCVNCPQACPSCFINSTHITCPSCPASQYLVSESVGCANCLTGCAQCTNDTSCSLCKTGYFLNITNSATQCSQCTDYCSQCNSTACTQCQPGYYIAQGNVCYECPGGCSSCVAPGNTCSACTKGYVQIGTGCVSLRFANCLVAGATGCTACNYGYYLTNKGICLQCLNYFGGTFCRQTQSAPANIVALPYELSQAQPQV